LLERNEKLRIRSRRIRYRRKRLVAMPEPIRKKEQSGIKFSFTGCGAPYSGSHNCLVKFYAWLVSHAKLEQKNEKLNLHCEARTKSSMEEDILVTHSQNWRDVVLRPGKAKSREAYTGTEFRSEQKAEADCTSECI
jgi:hypothetical protein